ncbi:hypothetical protein AAFP35_18975 [Gordonia sp. CPCC 206044]|uniref:hypothetical protein n=1 Tax=Gordonia sp. CPCC 206044 TaxID=3140793 RepID=UPI003AF3AD5E
MTEEPSESPPGTPHSITTPQPVYFLLARPEGRDGETPATIGERDVFFSEESALDSLDVHYAWCAAEHGGFIPRVTSAQWFLQSAMVGPGVAPGLGDVHLALAPSGGRPRAVAGGFLTEGELVHWSPFVRAVHPYLSPVPTEHTSFVVSYLGDDTVSFGQVWFAPLRSRRVYPKPIVVDADDV